MAKREPVGLHHNVERTICGVPNLLGFLTAWGRFPEQVRASLRLVLIVLLALLAGTGIFLTLPEGASRAAGTDASSQGLETGCPQVPPTPYFTIAYGAALLDSQDAPLGAVVRALSPRQATVGCFEVTTAGHYGAMFVYGEDTTVQPSIAGMRHGETVAFRVSGEAASPSPLLVWNNDHNFHEVSLTAGPIEVCYTLSTSASPGGGGSVDADTEPNCTGDVTRYVAGTQVQLTASPTQSYTFDHWSGDASGSASPTTITMDGDRSVTANFNQTCYTLSTSASPGASGSVETDIEPNCTGDTSRYAAGTQVQLTANPTQSYTFDHWSGDASGSANPTTVTMDRDRSVTANYQQCFSLNASVDPGGSGSVETDIAPNCTGDANKYAAGTQVRITANPALGYIFDHWSEGASGSANPTTVTMDQNRSVTANFSEQCYTLTTSVSPGGSGSVETDIEPNCAGDATKYAASTQLRITASPAKGYLFDHWSGDVVGSGNPITIPMDGDKAATGHFRQGYRSHLPLIQKNP